MTDSPELAVVVPARNEEDRVGECLSSLALQPTRIEVFFSDNASEDLTLQTAQEFGGRLRLTTRRTDSLAATEHFVSAARWALAGSDAPLFALLAGDDSWEAAFVQQALEALGRHPDAGAAFPTFVWVGGDRQRTLPPVDLSQASAQVRQVRALLLPDRRELANLVYGVYRRDAFRALVDAWERGGDRFGSDYAAAWTVLEHHRVVGADSAVSYRYERAGVDLIERTGLTRTGEEGLARKALLYVRLNRRINAELGRALVRARGGRSAWLSTGAQLARAPVWLWGAVGQVGGR